MDIISPFLEDGELGLKLSYEKPAMRLLFFILMMSTMLAIPSMYLWKLVLF